MKKTKDLAVKTGEYTNAKGEKKNRYQNVGAIMESDKGPFILLDKTFNPAGIQDGKNSVLISMFDVKEKHETGNNSNQISSDSDFDGIPF